MNLILMRLTAKKLPKVEIDKIINSKMNWIMSFSKPLKVILFGSASTGEMTEYSDIDIILIFPNDSDVKKIGLELEKNRPKDDWPHDLIFQTQESFEYSISKGGGACWLASQEGILLFERKLNEP